MLDALTSRARAARGQGGARSLQGLGQVPQGRTPPRAPVSWLTCSSLENWHICGRARGGERKRGGRGGAGWHGSGTVSSWEESAWGCENGHSATWREVCRLCWPKSVAWLHSLLSCLFESLQGKCCQSTRDREEALLLTSDLGLCKLPSRPLPATLPSGRHTRPVAPARREAQRHAGACGFAKGQCEMVYAWPFHPVGPTELPV